MSETPTSSEAPEQQKPASIDWLATAAGALAAVTSAVLLSTLGAVGTLVGAAIGSVAATIGSNLYLRWLRKSREKVASVQALARWRAAGLAGVRDGATAVSESAAAAEKDAENSGDGSTWRERLAELPWKRIAIASLIMFVVVVAAITIFELLAGRSVSSFVGRGDGSTTISDVTRGGSDSGEEKQEKDPTPAPASPGESATDDPDPSQAPPESEAPPSEGSSTEPSESAGSSAPPTEQPSEGSSPTSEPTPTQPVTPGDVPSEIGEPAS
ncbi:hypothetical protein J2S40_003867 [Nocardioides luteus]|uniref:Uncharacterized protein n=1 Tax=Nocardioides luteus TaxID=1844 RepID=A0ABQ5T012_9ACTN|nr:hypothetical protein [Nocardioides luteus]MDR7312809.1 hypothetical protein [Nocardioides luteus]GGR47695.1 hypothetical protein GCM10010197_11980 [Nocardioides luteus]GLJ69062.1 hypothetical protein GCM10017579_30980 [Nocardioides luteus]